MGDPKILDAPFIGYAPGPEVVQRLVHWDRNPDEGELRIEALVPPEATVLVVTHQRAHFSETDLHVAAASAAISASSFTQDHAAARREVDYATEADWATSTIIIDEQSHAVSVLQLPSGNWAGYALYKGMGIALGTCNMDVRDVRLATLSPADFAQHPDRD